jgi:guanine deaminase
MADITREGAGPKSAFYGTFIHSKSAQELEVISNGLLLISFSGEIISLDKDVVEDNIPQILSDHGGSSPLPVKRLKRGEFIIPGFVDTHNHAPQWTQRGTGLGLLILEWLNSVTFPHESKFEDSKYAQMVYVNLVDSFLKQGVTTASYYGSLHLEATKILAQICFQKGQRALVGKCNMERNCPAYYRDNSNAESLEATEELIRYITTEVDPQGLLVQPILTPRFAICCDRDLLAGLGKIAKRQPKLMIQTHFNEAMQEVEMTKELFPEFSNEADLYEHYGLFNEQTIMAHCIHPNEYEIKRMQERNIGVAHCPVSNTIGGEWAAAPVKRYLDLGIKVGLGTDSGGGYSSSILDAMRQAIITSNAKQMITGGKDKELTEAEAFYLATLGGAKVCCLDHKIGSFESGKEFDALHVSLLPEMNGASTMLEDTDSVETIFEKFVMTGDDRNIIAVYIRGRLVK